MAHDTQDAGSKLTVSELPTDFDRLTAKQHEVFRLVAEGRTTKEIAWRLDVTDSAINQRIEAVRSRAGSPPRAELARAYRRYMALKANGSDQDENAPWERQNANADVPRHGASEQRSGENLPHRSRSLAAHWVVPEPFCGPNAGLNRSAAIVIITVGLLAAVLIGLGVVQALGLLL